MARCSFWRFIWGRIMMKYSTTNISTSGSMTVSEPIRPPSAAAAGAVWAKAEEINTGETPLQQGMEGQETPRGLPRGQQVIVFGTHQPPQGKARRAPGLE